MPVLSHKLGPGQLTLGAAGSAKEFGAAVTNTVLEPSASDGEVIKVLSGDELVDAGEETWILKGSLLQSYDADSLLAWCFTNSGETLAFSFTPANGQPLKATGKVLVRAVAIGGDVNARAKSDFSFKATEVAISTVVDAPPAP